MDNPVSAAHWLVDRFPETALAYATHRAQRHVPTERGWRWWDACRSHVVVLLADKESTEITLLSPTREEG